jgi:hypothetical protein
LDDLEVDGKKIMEWVFKKCVGEARTGLSWLRMGIVGGNL